MEQHNLFILEEERRKRVCAYMFNKENCKFFDDQGWNFAKVLHHSTRAVNKGLNQKRSEK